MLSGNNSILNQAGRAKELTKEKDIEEKIQLAYSGAFANGEGDITKETFSQELVKYFGNDKVEDNTITENEDGSFKVAIDGVEITIASSLSKNDNSSEVLEYYNNPENSNISLWESNNGINPSKLTYLGHIESEGEFYRYKIDEKVYKISGTWNDGLLTNANSAEKVDLDAKIIMVNGEKQVETHFGTFSGEDVFYDEYSHEYNIYNENNEYIYRYDDDGKIIRFDLS